MDGWGCKFMRAGFVIGSEVAYLRLITLFWTCTSLANSISG